MRKRINTACKSAVRNAFKAIRLIQKYHHLKYSQLTKVPKCGFLTMIDNGLFTNISGCGDIFKEFLEKRHLTNYTGIGTSIKKPTDSDYWNAKLRIVPFDSTFTFLPKDVHEHKFLGLINKYMQT